MDKLISVLLVIAMMTGMLFSMPLELSATESVSDGCEHNYYEETITFPSCDESGCNIYICSLCGYSYSEETPAFGHTYEVVEVVAPRCDTTGYTSYACLTCGDFYNDDITEALGHDYQAVEVVAPD